MLPLGTTLLVSVIAFGFIEGCLEHVRSQLRNCMFLHALIVPNRSRHQACVDTNVNDLELDVVTVAKEPNGVSPPWWRRSEITLAQLAISDVAISIRTAKRVFGKPTSEVRNMSQPTAPFAA